MVELFKIPDKTIEKLTQFGPIHWIILGSSVLLTLILCLAFKNAKEKTYRILALIVWLILALFETLKQIRVFQVHVNYHWPSFPFQFCSTILYVLPVLFIINPKGKISSFIYYANKMFLATFIMFAGLISIIICDTITSKSLFITIQTFIHHGLQFVFGFYTLIHMRNKLSLGLFMESLIVFAISVGVALTINELMHYYHPEININMFYLNRFHPETYSYQGKIALDYPYPVILVCYCLGFSVIAFIMYSIGCIFRRKNTSIKY